MRPEDDERDADGTSSDTRHAERVSESSVSVKRRLMILIVLVMAAASIAGVVLTGLKDNAIYSKSVDELVANKARFLGRPVRVEGNLVHGSLEKRDQPCEYRFVLSSRGVEIPVRYPQCVVPDTFRDMPGMDVGVTVEGQLLANNSFSATSVLAKCPSKYEMQTRAQAGEQMPHGSSLEKLQPTH